jgi:hypothetical protein
MAQETESASSGAVKRGRPRKFDGTPVSVRLPKDLHDALSLDAIRQGEQLSVVIREYLRTALIRYRQVDAAFARANPPFRISKSASI